ncbi:MAG TPA: type II toxin-antitoxin system VapC family toxin [Terriglobia bacterium]|nr:type II toxin-antitoxin system VapC family toxin [Terriglobia bacterium]
MIVVDTNTIAYLYIQGQRSAHAEKILMKDNEWIAPLLWRSEFLSVLALCFRQGTLSLDDALVVAEAAQQFMQDREFDVSSAHVLQLVSTSKCSSYDCEFVALAESFKVPLITSDKELLKNFPSIAISMEKFVT